MYRRIVFASLFALFAVCISTNDILAWSFFEPQYGDHTGDPGAGTNARIWGGNNSELLIGANGSQNMNNQVTLYVAPGLAGFTSDQYGDTRAELHMSGAGANSTIHMKSGGGATVQVTASDVIIVLP